MSPRENVIGAIRSTRWKLALPGRAAASLAIALGLFVVAAIALAINLTQRDSFGWVNTPTRRFALFPLLKEALMPEITGLELLRQLKSNGISCPVIVVTGQADVPVAIEAIKLGAVDFIEKPYDAEVLLGAVRFALSGQASDGRDAQRAEIQQRLAALSPQEREVLQSLVDGRLNSAIAHDLGLNVRVVEVHRANVMAKIQATSLSHLVRMMLLVPS